MGMAPKEPKKSHGYRLSVRWVTIENKQTIVQIDISRIEVEVLQQLVSERRWLLIGV